MQIASTFFYTGLCKWTAGGNWLTDNPIYYLLNSSPDSVVKAFPLRGFFAQFPAVCYGIGLGIIAFELSFPFFLFWKRTRYWAIAAGILFHVMLLVTLHVPTIFFFLFPPQLLLFVEPEKIVAWIEARRSRNAARAWTVLFDGDCGFCQASIRCLGVLDLFGRLRFVNFRELADVRAAHPGLREEECRSRLQLVTSDALYSGFFAFRKMAGVMPGTLWAKPLFHLPGAAPVGSRVYDWIARNRFLFSRLHRHKLCGDHHCALGASFLSSEKSSAVKT